MGCGCNRGPEDTTSASSWSYTFGAKGSKGQRSKGLNLVLLVLGGMPWTGLGTVGLGMQVDGCPQATEVPMGSFRHPCPGLSVPSPPGPAVGSPAPRGKLQSAES